MKKTRFKKDNYQAVYVEWIDSTREKQLWFNITEIEKYYKKPMCLMQTISYLIMENKLEYVFCTNLQFEKGNCVYLGNVFSIPKGCVTKIKKIRKF